MSDQRVTVPDPPADPGPGLPDWQKARFDAILRNWEEAAKAVSAAQLADEKAERDATRALTAARTAAEIAETKAKADATRALAAADRAGEIERASAEQAADIVLEKLELDLDAELLKAFHKSLMEVTQGVLERSRLAAEYVQTIATAIATLYTGILAFAAVGAKHELPARGLIPVVFLGAAMALAAGYRGFLGRPTPVPAGFAQPARREAQLARAAFLGQWLNNVVLARGAFLRGAVFSLGLGAAFLPIGVVTSASIEALSWRWAGVAAFALSVVVVWQFLVERIAMAVQPPTARPAVAAIAWVVVALIGIANQDGISTGLRLLTSA